MAVDANVLIYERTKEELRAGKGVKKALADGYSNAFYAIFDRVREFFGLYPKRNKKVLFNDSLNTTLARTLNTSLSTLIVLLCIFILGGDSIRSFAFAMILGVVFGT